MNSRLACSIEHRRNRAGKKKKPKTKQNRRNKRRDIESTKENVQIDKFFPPYYQGVSGLPLPKTSQRKALGSISPQLIPFLLFEKFLKLKDSAREKKNQKIGRLQKTQSLNEKYGEYPSTFFSSRLSQSLSLHWKSGNHHDWDPTLTASSKLYLAAGFCAQRF